MVPAVETAFPIVDNANGNSGNVLVVTVTEPRMTNVRTGRKGSTSNLAGHAQFSNTLLKKDMGKQFLL